MAWGHLMSCREIPFPRLLLRINFWDRHSAGTQPSMGLTKLTEVWARDAERMEGDEPQGGVQRAAKTCQGAQLTSEQNVSALASST